LSSLVDYCLIIYMNLSYIMKASERWVVVLIVTRFVAPEAVYVYVILWLS
jgi:hypothetical protein